MLEMIDYVRKVFPDAEYKKRPSGLCLDIIHNEMFYTTLIDGNESLYSIDTKGAARIILNGVIELMLKD